MTQPDTIELLTLIDPSTGLEYVRVPASEFIDGDLLDSELENLDDLVNEDEIPSATPIVRSQNGYTCGRQYCASYTVPGTTTRLALRAGDVSVVALDFCSWYDKNIESIDGGPLDDWGFAERMIRGSDEVYTNHFSGTAWDLDALKHPMGKHTLSEATKVKIRAKLAEYNGVIRPGFDYHSRPDDMHYEINKGPLAVRTEAVRIRIKGMKPRYTPAPFGYTTKGDRVLGLHLPLLEGPDVRGIINALRLAGNRDIPLGNRYTSQVAARMNYLKQRHGIHEAGCGAGCWAYLRSIAHPIG